MMHLKFLIITGPGGRVILHLVSINVQLDIICTVSLSKNPCRTNELYENITTVKTFKFVPISHFAVYSRHKEQIDVWGLTKAPLILAHSSAHATLASKNPSKIRIFRNAEARQKDCHFWEGNVQSEMQEQLRAICLNYIVLNFRRVDILSTDIIIAASCFAKESESHI